MSELREEAKTCRKCPLWANATQTVFGAGDPHARVMLDLYVTNAVKYFKWEPRGKRRLHKTPAQREIVGDLRLIKKALDRP